MSFLFTFSVYPCGRRSKAGYALIFERTLICMVKLVCLGGQASALSSLEGDVEGKATGLQNNIDGVSRTADHLTISFYALFAWVAVVTVALLTVVAVGCRRWRRQRRRAADDDDVDRLTGDASSVCSRPTTDSTAAVAVCRDRTAFEGVEIGRRVSPQSSVDDTLTTGVASSSAEP